jgi:hypothetical protein
MRKDKVAVQFDWSSTQRDFATIKPSDISDVDILTGGGETKAVAEATIDTKEIFTHGLAESVTRSNACLCLLEDTLDLFLWEFIVLVEMLLASESDHMARKALCDNF